LYDELTALLVSWRKLELTTWARLFDLETDKFRDNAMSWFFVAYETIIAALESIDEEQDVKLHAKNLLKTLESFMKNTTLGQFEQRILILQQFGQHARMRKQDSKAFKVVHALTLIILSLTSRTLESQCLRHWLKDDKILKKKSGTSSSLQVGKIRILKH
jgi:midasin